MTSGPSPAPGSGDFDGPQQETSAGNEDLRQLASEAAGTGLFGAVCKAARADEHIRAFDTGVETFVELLDSSVVCREDGEEWVYELQLEGSSQLVELALTLGDAVHNLRASLDHAAYALVLEGGSQPTINTAFPIWRDNAPPDNLKWRGRCSTALKGASHAAVDEVAAIEAFPGGRDERLRDVHLLDIHDKHHAIVVAGTAISHVGVDVGAFEPGETEMSVRFTTPERAYPVEDGSVLVRTPMVGGVTPTFEFDVAMEVGETQRPVLARPCLSQMACTVVEVLERLLPLVRAETET